MRFWDDLDIDRVGKSFVYFFQKIVISWLWSGVEAVSGGHSPGGGAGRRATESGACGLCLARFLRRRSVGTRRQVGLPRLRRDIRPPPPPPATMHLAETNSFVSQYETRCAPHTPGRRNDVILLFY